MLCVWPEGRGSAAAAVWDVDEQTQVSQGGPSWERMGCIALAVKSQALVKFPSWYFRQAALLTLPNAPTG